MNKNEGSTAITVVVNIPIPPVASADRDYCPSGTV